jgi:hypothetical protein
MGKKSCGEAVALEKKARAQFFRGFFKLCFLMVFLSAILLVV